MIYYRAFDNFLMDLGVNPSSTLVFASVSLRRLRGRLKTLIGKERHFYARLRRSPLIPYNNRRRAREQSGKPRAR